LLVAFFEQVADERAVFVRLPKLGCLVANRVAAQRVAIRGTTVEEIDQMLVKNVALAPAQFVVRHDVGQNLAAGRVDERQFLCGGSLCGYDGAK
jgi:hypothetical protein